MSHTSPVIPPAVISPFDAVEIIEGGEATQEEYIEAFQLLIDRGLVWQLQGFYGREATRLIAEGLCHR